MMKVCYLIQTHKQVKQIERLVRTIQKMSPTAEIVIKHDFSKCFLDESVFQEFANVTLLPSQGGRGNFGLVQSYLEVVDWLLTKNICFDWLVNLSGQDYPIQPLPQVEAFLESTFYDGFLLHFEVFSPESHWKIQEGYTRYCYQYQTLIAQLPAWQKKVLRPAKVLNYVQPFFRLNFAYGLTLGLKIPTPFHSGFKCYGGSYLCTLSRACVEYLHRFVQENPDIIRYYRSVAIPDESFIQTILVNSKQFHLCNDSKRYFDFSQTSNGHPRVLSSKDFGAIAQSQGHFARKFDISIDSNILGLIDQELLGLERSPKISTLITFH